MKNAVAISGILLLFSAATLFVNINLAEESENSPRSQMLERKILDVEKENADLMARLLDLEIQMEETQRNLDLFKVDTFVSIEKIQTTLENLDKGTEVCKGILRPPEKPGFPPGLGPY